MYTHMFICKMYALKISSMCLTTAQGKILPSTYFAIKASQTSKPAGYNPVFTSCARMLSIKNSTVTLQKRKIN